jgi:hypothetical protein
MKKRGLKYIVVAVMGIWVMCLMKPMANHLYASDLGSLGEIFDGDAPMASRGCIA